MLNRIGNILENGLDVIFPTLCHICFENPISKHTDNYFCVSCHFALPYTDHFENRENLLMSHFYGRLRLEYAASLLYFSEGSLVQKLLHNLKYKGIKEVGHQAGAVGGMKIYQSKIFQDADCMVPVPIHSKKIITRGYNQSEVIAEGIHEETNIPILRNAIIKKSETSSQTNKSRTDRLDNVEGVFKVVKPESVVGKNILIVDDVVTTGATIESLGKELIASGANKLYLFSVALAV
ncbi:MAG: hypothetical protein RLZZ546_650 [Bacteroidota bacterium]|jgi:ComF family protein